MPKHADLLDQALAHYGARRFEPALKALQAIPGISRLPLGCSLIGGILIELNRPADALTFLDEAVRLGGDGRDLRFQRGSALSALGRPEEALPDLDRAVQAQPDNARAWCNRGWVLHGLGRPAEAIAALDEALRLRPDFADAQFNRSLPRLISGDYAGGLADYEARYRAVAAHVPMPDTFECPVWQGEDLAGKTILAHAEQGLGDAIQFVRFVPDLARRGGAVVLGAPEKLHRLLRPFQAIADVRNKSRPGEDFDFTVPLMSLPHRLGTVPQTIPWDGPYLAAEPERVAAWRRRIGGDGLRIGIAWQGNPNGIVDRGRSLALASYASLARLDGVRLIALQKGHGHEQLATLPEGMTVTVPGDDFDAGPDAFLDTAAVMADLDLIVTTDTSIAHLAGALGRPTFLLLKHVPDWRWGLTGETTPWYPTMRLFRQTARGDWGGVMSAVTGAVAALIRS